MPETISDIKEKDYGKGRHPKDEAITPGIYRVDELGNFAPAVDWQPVLQRIKWEELDKLIENWMRRGGSERITNLVGIYILTGLILLIAGYLALIGIIEGQAIVGFLGAAIGYLLARSRGQD
jgi:hypothetical protein